MRKDKLLGLIGPAAALALGIAFSSGCGQGDAPDHPVPQTKAEQDKQRQSQIDAIKNNPNMPEDQKAIALGALSVNRGNMKK